METQVLRQPEADAVQAAATPRRPTLRRRLGLLVVTLVLLLVGDMVAARIYRLATGHTWPAGDPERIYRIPADAYHHDLLPDYSTDSARWGGSYPVRTDSLGFRDAQVRDVALEPKGRRIVLIGDSFTEGVGVAYGETFAGRIASALAPDAEVLDAGVMSYAPCIYYRKVKHLLEDTRLGFNELIVAIDVGDAEDEASVYELVDDTVRVRGLRDRAQEFVKGNSILFFTLLDYCLRQPIGRLEPPPAIGPGATDVEIEAALRKRCSVNVRRSRWPHDERLWKAFGEEGVRLMTAHMDQLLALLEAKGIALTVVVYPWPDQIVAGDTDCRHERVWRDWCAARGVRFVDTFPKFEIGAPLRRRVEVLDSCFIQGDVHMSAEGHRRIAEAILEALNDRATTTR